MKYRNTAADQIKAIYEVDPDRTILNLRRIIRNAGPKNIKSPEFRIWHEEGNKLLKQIRTERLDDKGKGRGLFRKIDAQ